MEQGGAAQRHPDAPGLDGDLAVDRIAHDDVGGAHHGPMAPAQAQLAVEGDLEVERLGERPGERGAEGVGAAQRKGRGGEPGQERHDAGDQPDDAEGVSQGGSDHRLFPLLPPQAAIIGRARAAPLP